MRKNAANRIFTPLETDDVEGFFPSEVFPKMKSVPVFSGRGGEVVQSGMLGAVYCKPAANVAYLTGGNPFVPYFHAVAEIAATKDKAKAAVFFDGSEKPFSEKEKERCENTYKEIFSSLRIGKNELTGFTCEGNATSAFSQTYAFSIGDEPCRLRAIVRRREENEGTSWNQFLLFTDARISADAMKKMLEGLAEDPLCVHSPASAVCSSSYGGVFGGAAFLSSGCAKNFEVRRAAAEYAKTFRTLRAILVDFLEREARSRGGRFFRISVIGAKSAKEAKDAARYLASKRALYVGVKNGDPDPFCVLEAAGEAGYGASGALTATLSSSAGFVRLFSTGSPLFPGKEKVREILAQDSFALTVDLGCGNYSFSSRLFVGSDVQKPTAEKHAGGTDDKNL